MAAPRQAIAKAETVAKAAVVGVQHISKVGNLNRVLQTHKEQHKPAARG